MVKNAKDRFDAFLKKYNCQPEYLDNSKIGLSDIISDTCSELRITGFAALEDIYLYANLLSKYITDIATEQISGIIDLGAGSSIPTIKAFMSSPKNGQLRIIAVDNDPDAIEVSRSNVSACGLDGRYEFIHDDMLNFINRAEIKKGYIIASNPPYVPTPDKNIVSELELVDGGEDGAKYIGPILSHNYPSGTILIIRWCSLCNPSKIIKVIEDRYDILYMEANTEQFGAYTRMECLKGYLNKLRGENLAVYEEQKDERRELVSVGCVLRRR